jgi:WD40 repeat protein
VDRGRKRAVLTGHKPGKRGGVLSLAFTPDGRTLASGGEDKALRLWQVATGVELLSLGEQPAAVNGVAFSPDGRTLAAALHDGSVRIWEAARRGQSSSP